MKMDLILILFIIIVPLIAEIKVKMNYNTYSKQKNSLNMTGKEVARKILDNNGLNYVNILQTKGSLTDHYNPLTKKIFLSENTYGSKSIAAAAVAAHEVGHAIQDKESYSYLRFRNKMVPFVNFTSRAATILILISFIFNFMEMFDAGIVLLLVGLLFQLITLPVEFNASNRAKEQLKSCGLLEKNDISGTKSMLNAAAFTYVASFLAMALQILRLILIRNSNNN
ncbi:neutral zinc metallopeptidase [Clostridium sp. CAG:1000]|nr:neutral zinc metallopeptidase [Clostridium sp. CAG:1000]